jgi:hypothetical protein
VLPNLPLLKFETHDLFRLQSRGLDLKHHYEWIAAWKGGPQPYSEFQPAPLLPPFLCLHH